CSLTVTNRSRDHRARRGPGDPSAPTAGGANCSRPVRSGAIARGVPQAVQWRAAMSNFLAVATVTATLGQVLQAAISSDVPGATVTTIRPEGPGARPAEVNVYLYQVTPNAAYRNADLPTRGSNGQVVQRPQAALTLHYLISFYGDDSKLEPQ